MNGASFQRMRAYLGTFVEVRVEGLHEADAARAVDAAFAEIAAVHRCMSFHSADSDLARLHAARPGTRVRVDARTRVVLELAIRIAQASDGCFDPTVAAQQVAWGFLPRPHSPYDADPRASWHDIELLEADGVRLRRATWLDLGGIAKGWAVDRAVEILIARGARQICVNAGGDLRIAGPRAESVHWRRDGAVDAQPAVELADAALATSCGYAERRRRRGRWHSAHVDGRDRAPADTTTWVSVLAARCAIADALTKVALCGDASLVARALGQFDAQAAIGAVSKRWSRPEAAA